MKTLLIISSLVVLCGCSLKPYYKTYEHFKDGIQVTEDYKLNYRHKYLYLQTNDKNFKIGYDERYKHLRIFYKKGF